MRARKPLIAGLVGLLMVSLTAANTTSVTAAAAPLPAASTGNAAETVTLITGDRVTVTGDGSMVVRPGEGRDHVTFATQRVGARWSVIPSDAMPLLASGELDRRLFDVTYLRQLGYHERADLPLIVQGDLPRDDSATVVRDLPVLDAAAVRVDQADAGAFWSGITNGDTVARMAAGVETVWLDGLRQPSLDQSVPQVGAPAAWEQGLDGTGVTVAVLDTGIDANHPDLAGRIAGRRNFTEGEEDDRDLVGHGTHVASTVAGSGAASDGRYPGVAPGAELLDGKVCTEFGCLDSWILAGMEWAVEQGAAVVNMSLTGPPVPDDPVVAAVDRLTDQYSALFVVAAGNDGLDGSVGSPAIADAALAVGAVDDDDALAEFSSRGPAPDGGLKPDLTAPGVEIVAARSADGAIGEPGQPYTTLSGTSMATPHVAGAVAILAQQHPEWTAERLKATLMASAAP